MTSRLQRGHLGPEGAGRPVRLGGRNGLLISLLNNHPELGVTTHRHYNTMEMTGG